MKKYLIILIILSTGYSERGDLVSVNFQASRNITNNQSYIDNELSSIVQSQFALEPIEYGVTMYKISYETIDANGNYHIATGSVAYPRVDWPDIPDQGFPMISYQHGTVVEKSSVTSQTGLWILPAYLAGRGYVYIEPDYLGLGESEGRHPYQIKEPYGTAVVDLLRAIKNYNMENDDFELNEQLFLVGYSEGGYATMAAHQIIERDYSDEFEVTVSFPMAGAYSMSDIMVDVMLDFQPYGEPYYFPYVLFSYLENYPSIGVSEQFILPEYLFLEDLFDGYHSSTEINDLMPSIPAEIMIPEEITAFQNNFSHPLKEALRENDIIEWIPQSPIYIFHGIADELVPYENSQMAYDYFVSNNVANVYLELLPESYGGHQDAAPWALLGAFNFAEQYKIIDCLSYIDCEGICGGNAEIDICGDCNGNNEGCILGDLNLDDTLDVLDVVLLTVLIFDNSFNLLADLNSDNIINIFDIIMLIEVIMSS